MADNGIKKVTISKSDLPAFNSTYNQYVVRYRIISEDRNKTSHWSPQYKLTAPSVTRIEYSYSKDIANKLITFVWKPTIDAHNFDVFVKWNGGNWLYASTVSTTTYAAIIPDNATKVMVAVQVPTFPKNRLTTATFFESSEISL